jgi:Fe-S cluster biogenesis protein NfuA
MSRQVQLHIEGVPNPNAMRFVLGNGILTQEPFEFGSFKDTAHSPLAKKLMLFRYVERVLINRNFITVLKRPGSEPSWDEALPELRDMITRHLAENEPILYIGMESLTHERSDDVVVGIVKDLLDKSIRPAAQEDGGDIFFHSYQDGVLRLSMHGACFGCPYSRKTIKEGVEPLLSNMIPEIREVIATQWEAQNEKVGK